MMNKLIIFFYLICLLASCRRPDDPIGPEYKVPGKDFKLFDDKFKGSLPSVDFLAGQKESFEAAFSQKVTWKLTLTGSSSGAVKTFSGFSDKIDSTNNLWDGKHEALYFFRSKEDVIAELSFLGSQLVFRDTIHILNERKWDVPNKIAVALNFDKSKFDYAFYDGPTDFLPAYKVTYAVKGTVKSDMESTSNNRIENVLRDKNGDTIPGERPGSVEGNFFYRMAGQDRIYTGPGNSDYYIGGAGLAKPAYFGLDQDPSNVFFNIYIYGTGDPDAKLVINFDEDDDGKNGAEAGGLSENYILYEDEYAWEVPVSWKGWKLVSVRYSELKLSGDGMKSTRGNKKPEPNRIAKMGFVLLTLSRGGRTSIIFDFPNFTMGKPFNPNE
jgi:hypothetical protein